MESRFKLKWTANIFEVKKDQLHSTGLLLIFIYRPSQKFGFLHKYAALSALLLHKHT